MSAAAPDDTRWMQVALQLAKRGVGRTWPNPSVGCVVVSDGICVGRGHTQPGGRPHAETVALAQAGGRSRGAIVYVTLEPCSHHGQTPPCAEALIAAGVNRVVIGTLDPDARVSGRGVQMLREAGIVVDTGCCEAQAVAVTAGFLSRMRRNRPYLSLKLATTLDGRIATASGESRWITGPEARRFVHMLRAKSDAVLIGSGTALADDPMLDVRDLGLAECNPVRVVLDGHLKVPPESRLVQTSGNVPLWLLHSASARPPDGSEAVRYFQIQTEATDQLDLPKALARLSDEGITSVLCEGGGTLAASLLRAGLVDELIWIHAGFALGGSATPAIGDLAISRLAEAQRFELAERRQLGADSLTRWINPATYGQIAGTGAEAG